jgi:putative SOS response-associated peptidase YedK
MCGRYYRIADKQTIVDHFHSPAATDEPFPPAYNIAPGTTQPVIRQGRDTGARELVGMRWGLVGFGSSGPDPKRSTFNARSENLTKSDLWRVPLHKRRCLVPVSGYYEWGRKPDKLPFRFTLRDEPLYALAGLWDAWKNPTGDWLQSFSIITVKASAAMSTIHDRMPAILMPPEYDEWLDRGETERPPTRLLRPYPRDYAPDPPCQPQGRKHTQPGHRPARPPVGASVNPRLRLLPLGAGLHAGVRGAVWVGDLLFGRVAPGCGLLALSGNCLAVLFWSLNRRGCSVWR